MSKTITVFGATGTQGGSVVNAILADATLSKEFSIRGVTRDKSKANAQALTKRGVEMVNGDINSDDSVKELVQGAHTVFLVTDFWQTGSYDTEKAQGKRVADASKQAGVKHIIFSSLLNVTEITNGRLSHVKHFDGKAEIEQHIRSSGVPATFVMPGYFMSNFQGLVMRKEDDGSYNLTFPVGEKAQFPLIDAAQDMGNFVKPALKNPEQFNGKQILAAADYYTVSRIISEFEEVSGKKINFHQVNAEQYKSALPDFMAEELLQNHWLLEEPGYYNGRSLKESIDLLDEKPVTWKEFVKAKFT